MQHGSHKLWCVGPHHLDGEAARIFDERLLWWNVGWEAHGDQRENTRIIGLSHTNQKIGGGVQKPSGVSTYNARLFAS
jgi:hypothetical protein